MWESNILSKIKKSTILVAFIILLISCGRSSFDSREKLIVHVANIENGFVQHKSINGVDYSLTYRPTDLLVSQELTREASKEELDSLRKKYGEYLYFNLSLSKNDKEVLSSINTSRSDFGAMVNQLAFDMGKKIHLFNQKKDTVELLDYIYPREYGMGGATNIMFVYPKDEKLFNDEFIHFTIEDIGLRTGEVGFRIPTELLKNEPKLNF